MNEITSLKNLFRPIQPTVGSEGNDVSYKEFTPSSKLSNYIFCYWQLKSTKQLSEPFTYQVVSDGCIDIFFEVEHPSNSFVMGFCRKYTEFELGVSFNYFGIRFLPSFFHLFFNVNAKSLSNQFQELKNVQPELSTWIDNTGYNNHIVSNFNEKFESYLPSLLSSKVDERFYNAVTEILSKNGNIDLDKEMIAGLSARQLRRKFNLHIGTTPKAFANVVRFQYILNANPSRQSLKENKIYYDAGFYDQAHFIKSFKTFYGVTPSEAFD